MFGIYFNNVCYIDYNIIIILNGCVFVFKDRKIDWDSEELRSATAAVFKN